MHCFFFSWGGVAFARYSPVVCVCVQVQCLWCFPDVFNFVFVFVCFRLAYSCVCLFIVVCFVVVVCCVLCAVVCHCVVLL